MPIYVKYFASLRERLGRSEDVLTDCGDLTVADVWRRASREAALPFTTLAAINMEYSRPDDIVREGDEVAFFPPVTGG